MTAQRELERSRRETQRLVSHELKTPLASIAGFGAMLERYELDRDEQRRVAGLIRGEADRLGRMVVSFLELERLGSGRWPAERRPLDLSELVARRCQSLEASREGAVLRLEAPAAATVLGDPELVERLVDNLVGNALKFSPAGTPVEVVVEPGPAGISLQVRDRGPGIPRDEHERVFEPFYRGGAAERNATPGSGLGLSLVRHVVRAHGGRVHVDGREGGGAAVVVELPVAAAGGDRKA